MKPFRENWVGRGRWKPLADELNRIGRCLNNLTGMMGIDVLPNSRGGYDFSVQLSEAVDVGFRRIDTLVVGGAKAWPEAEWTRTETEGEATNVVYCPYDGVTAPTYKTAMPARTTMPADDGSDDRADGMYIDLARVPGPEFHVHRA